MFTKICSSTKGAFDLASVMVGVLVIGIIGGVAAAAIFAVIPWAQDNAAKSSLSAIDEAQNAAAYNGGTYKDLATLQAATGLSGGELQVVVGDAGQCYLSASKSASGKVFYKTSKKSTIYEKAANSVSDCANLSSITL